MVHRLLCHILFCVGCSALLPACKLDTKQVESFKLTSPAPGVLPVQITQTPAGYQLLRGGKPYRIKGVSGLQQIDRIREFGGNSIRLYTTNYADAILDKAQQQGLTVMLGLWMKPEHEGFDYFDSRAIAQQKEEIRQEVLRFRNHPALLVWNVGNELDLNTHNPRTFQALKDIVDMIHELDPYHPVTTTLSGNYRDHMANILRFCPNVDFLTFNVFGSLSELSAELKKYKWDGPYLIGEFGGRGWWEAPQTSWDAPLDQSSSEKALYMRPRFQKTIVGDSTHCLGAYVMYWGQRFEQTNMWFSLFTATGEKTAVVDMIHYLWTGKVVPNKAPQITQLLMGGREAKSSLILKPGKTIPAKIAASDPEGDPLRVHWEVVRDVNEWNTLPQNRTATEPVKKAIAQASGLEAVVRAPTELGPYRLLVLVYDGQGSVATHSYPFRVGPTPRISGKIDEQVR